MQQQLQATDFGALTLLAGDRLVNWSEFNGIFIKNFVISQIQDYILAATTRQEPDIYFHSVHVPTYH